jgi:hypothetical protein
LQQDSGGSGGVAGYCVPDGSEFVIVCGAGAVPAEDPKCGWRGCGVAGYPSPYFGVSVSGEQV